ncbi:MAG: Ig-like domain-containing protein, partial [Promethearchaeota archaeon]
STNALSGIIKDVAGNDAVLTLPTPGSSGSLSYNKEIVIDTSYPVIINVSTPQSNGAYTVGEIIDIEITFSENVYVTGIPQLTLETGTGGAVVNYAGGTGTDILTFRYIVAAGDNSPDLDYVSINALSLNGGVINDTIGHNAILTLPFPGASGSLGYNKDIVIDTTAPTVIGVSSTNADGTYGVGEIIDITVIFSETVDVTGAPQLILEMGSPDVIINYVSGSGSTTLTFTYTVISGHNTPDLDYNATDALSLNGGVINDTVGNNADLILPAPGTPGSLGDNKEIIIDTIAPTIINVSSTRPDGTYGEGEIINIIINFSESVYVTGTPQLTLETGDVDAVVDYSSGSGTNILIFTYTVASGHYSEDLDYKSANALSLNGGSIKDSGGNDAILTLPTPGTVGSLSFNKDLIVEARSAQGIFGWFVVIGIGSAIGLSIIIYAIVSKKRRAKSYNY